MRRCIKTLLLSALWLPLAARAFVVSDIRVEGLQRISAGTVFATLPINLGDDVDQQDLQAAVRALFRTGNFDDIKIGRDGNVLVLIVTERPSISEINIEGNKAIETENLLEGLQNAGLSEGQVFKRSTLESMKQELTRQYVSQGRYDATVETDVVAGKRTLAVRFGRPLPPPWTCNRRRCARCWSARRSAAPTRSARCSSCW